MAFVVVAKWTAKEGEADKVEECVRKLTPLSREEPGNLFYQAHRDPENPNLFYLYEQYVDEDAYKAHGESEHRSEEHTSELQSRQYLVCRLLLEKKKT